MTVLYATVRQYRFYPRLDLMTWNKLFETEGAINQLLYEFKLIANLKQGRINESARSIGKTGQEAEARPRKCRKTIGHYCLYVFVNLWRPLSQLDTKQTSIANMQPYQARSLSWVAIVFFCSSLRWSLWRTNPADDSLIYGKMQSVFSLLVRINQNENLQLHWLKMGINYVTWLGSGHSRLLTLNYHKSPRDRL